MLGSKHNKPINQLVCEAVKKVYGQASEAEIRKLYADLAVPAEPPDPKPPIPEPPVATQDKPLSQTNWSFSVMVAPSGQEQHQDVSKKEHPKEMLEEMAQEKLAKESLSQAASILQNAFKKS